LKSKQIKKSAILFLIGFLLLFSIRAVYTFRYTEVQFGGTVSEQSLNTVNITEERKVKNNYASTKEVVVVKETAKSVSVDQKYERIGFLSSESNKFEEDCDQIKNAIKQNKAIVQFEDNAGIKGKRTLELSMGVHPDKFDEFIDQLKKIANLTYFRVQKTDKTSEYKDLKAKQLTMEKYKESLVKLKEKGGSVKDLTELENKIIEVEEKIQGFGVQLGDFNQENELCTVKLSVRENIGVIKNSNTSLFYMAKTLTNAFVWSLGYYFLFLVLILLGGICGYVLLAVLGKAKKTYEDFTAKEREETKV
jgi:hypothetical protein